MTPKEYSSGRNAQARLEVMAEGRIPTPTESGGSTNEELKHHLDSEGHDPSTQSTQTSAAVMREVHSSEFAKIKLPSFWQKRPKLWFAQLESEFDLHRVRSDDTKYHTIVRNLDEQTIITVADHIENPPATQKYENLKTALINRYTDSEEKRLRQLLSGVELGTRKPSELLRELRHLAGGTVTENVLMTLWIQRLPTSTQETLAVVEDIPLAKLAELADKILDRKADSISAAAVETHPRQEKTEVGPDINEIVKRLEALETSSGRGRARSNRRAKNRPARASRSRSSTSAQQRPCFYHRKFGDKAWKCTVTLSYGR